MADEVRKQVGFDLEAAQKTLCWIVQPRHLKQAPLGTALHRIYEVLYRNRVFPNPDHSFITWCSREDGRVGSDHPGYYRELLLHDTPTAEARRARLRETVAEALGTTEIPPSSLMNVAKAVGPFVRFIAELIRFSGGRI